jgi:PAS domain S-box-containing protein
MQVPDEMVAAQPGAVGDPASFSLLEALPALLYVADSEGAPIYCNARLLEFNGSTLEAMRMGAWIDFVHPEDRERTIAAWQTGMLNGEPYEFEHRARRFDGEYRWLLTRASPLYGDDGTLAGWIGVSAEIERARAAEQALVASEQRFAAFMEHVPAAAWIKDAEGRYVFANPEAVRAFGIGREDLYGLTDADVFPVEIASDFAENDRRVRESGQALRTTETLIEDDGPHRSIVAKFPLPEPDGAPQYVGGIAIDVTPQQAAEDRLRESEARYRALYELADASSTAHAAAEEKLMLLVEAASGLIDPTELHEILPDLLQLAARLIEADAYALWSLDAESRAWTTISTAGLSEAYLRASSIAIDVATPSMQGTLVVPDVDAESILEHRRAGYRAEGVRSILVVPLRIGDDGPATLTFYYRQAHEATENEVRIAEALAGIASSAINSSLLHTEQRRINDALVDANRRLAFLADASSVLSRAFEHVETGEGDGFDPSPLANLARVLAPAFADICVIDVFESPDHSRRLDVAAADGVDLRNLAHTHLRDWKIGPGESTTVNERLASGRSLLVKHVTDEWIEACASDEEQLAHARATGAHSLIMAPMRARGETIGVFTAVSLQASHHYTTQDLQLVEEIARRAAVALDNARLFEAARQTAHELRVANAAKDEFLGLVSHELKTPITTILGNAEVLERRFENIEPESRAAALSDIRGEAERLHRIIDNLLVLARLEQGKTLEREPMLVRRVVDLVVTAHRRAFPLREIIVRFDLPPTPVLGSPQYLEQTLRNLIGNAEKYSPRDRPITVAASREGSDFVVRVLDEGPGVREEEIASLFTPFYRSGATAAMAHGVGIGLAVCKRLIEAQGGRVWAARRSAGGGSEFGFALPIVTDAD